MKVSRITSALILSLAGMFSAQAAEPSDNSILLQISFDDCHKVTEMDSYMKETFNQTAIRRDGNFLGNKAALYANAEDDSYAIVVDPENAVPTPKYPLACIFGQNRKTGYAAFLESKQYKAIFKPH